MRGFRVDLMFIWLLGTGASVLFLSTAGLGPRSIATSLLAPFWWYPLVYALMAGLSFGAGAVLVKRLPVGARRSWQAEAYTGFVLAALAGAVSLLTLVGVLEVLFGLRGNPHILLDARILPFTVGGGILLVGGLLGAVLTGLSLPRVAAGHPEDA